MASPAVVPQTLPANFTGWDQPKNGPPQTLPADFQGWDKPAATPPEPSLLSQAGSVAKDVGIGALKGAGSTANSIGHLLFPDRLAKAVGMTPPTPEQEKATFAPTDTSQSVGKGIEQTGEFLVPGLGEEAATGRIAEAAPKLAPATRIGYSALTSGLVNKAQGGGFGTGAAAGAAGAGIGEGLKAMAPGIAESAMKIRKLDRSYGKTPGRAILDETTGLRPGTVAESAQNRLNELNPELEKAVASGGDVNFSEPRGIIQSAQDKAVSRNAAGSHAQLEPMTQHLTRNFSTGADIPESIPASDALNLKRGFGDEFIHNWNPETMSGTRGTAARTYGSMARQIHMAAPGSQELDERISSLIPVAKRAASTELNADTGQRILGRIGAHTGAATLGGLGAAEGYREKGVPGAILGAVGGIAVPELIASPTGQMALARGLNSTKTLPKLLVGSGLQANR